MMKKLIEESGLSVKEFSEKYGIPYNTVRQWSSGSRSAPDWLVNLFKAELAYKPLSDEKNFMCKADGYFYEYFSDEGRVYRAFLPNEPTEDQIDWFNARQYDFIHGTSKPKLTKRKIYKYYEVQEGIK